MAPPEESPTKSVSARRPPPGARTIVLVLDGPIARADVPRISERVRDLLERSDADLVVCDVGGLGDPDAVVVDALARVVLIARRLGRSVRLRDPSCELRDLLALMGLGDVVPVYAGLPLEPRGEAEGREEGRGVEEEADPRDPAV